MIDGATQMKPIWYFVGWVLIVIGMLVLAAGLYYLIFPIDLDIALRGLHMNIWWGAVLVLGGALLTFFNRKPVKV